MRPTLVAVLLLAGCSQDVTRLDGGAGGGAGGGGEDLRFDCRVDGPCTEAQVSATSVGTCTMQGVCQCQPGYVRNPITETCWPQMGFCRGPDGGMFNASGVDVAPSGLCGDTVCATGGSCFFDAGVGACVPAAADKCVGPLGCGVVECRDGCRCSDASEGKCVCDGPKACDVGNDQTCNEDGSAMPLLGTCVKAPGAAVERCLCNVGASRNPATGKCRVVDAGP